MIVRGKTRMGERGGGERKKEDGITLISSAKNEKPRNDRMKNR